MCFADIDASSQIQQIESNLPLYQTGQLYLKIRDSVSATSITNIKSRTSQSAFESIFQRYGVTKIELPFVDFGTTYFDRAFRITIGPTNNLDSLILVLNNNNMVEYAEKVPAMYTQVVSNDPIQPYPLALINADGASNIHQGGGAIVAIVDDAVLITHQDLAANIHTANRDVADLDNNPNPPFSGINIASPTSFSHGTHVAGIAGGVTNNGLGIASIGWNNKIMAVKTTGNATQPSNSIPFGYDGIAWAATHGAHVINMSWGGGAPSQLEYNVVVAAKGNNIVLIAAAGNNANGGPFYPAAYGESLTNQAWEQFDKRLVIAVSSIDANNNKSSFSNFGSWVDIASYGSNVYSSIANSSNGQPLNTFYNTYSGTSMAAPLVSGVAGLMRSYAPTRTANQIIDCLLNSSNPDIYGSNHPNNFLNMFGKGRVDAEAALKCLGVPCANNPIVVISQSEVALCPNQTIALTANQGIAYQWSTGQTTQGININAAGNYSVTVTFAGGCTAAKSVNIQTADPNAHLVMSENSGTTPNDGILCGQDMLVLSVYSGRTYQWSAFGATTPAIPGTINAGSNLPFTWNFSVTVTDVGGCVGVTDVVSGTIQWRLPPTAAITPVSPVICLGQNITLTASGGISYNWSTLATTPNITVQPVSNTTYSVTVTDAFGCSASTSTTVTVSNSPVAVSITQSGSSTTCANATLLTANPSPAGSYTYQWRLNGVNIAGATAATFSPTQSGSYSVVATNSAGCTGTSSATIINIPPPIIATLSGITATCLGGATPLTATPSGSGFSYQWSTNTDGLSNSNTAYGYTSLQNPNTFSVTVTAPSGCTASATFNTNFDFYCCGSGTNPGELRINNFNTFATTNISQVSSSISNASTIYLWGTLNINSTINLTYKTFLMGPNARIIIQPGVNVVLSHDVFRPCTNYMWDGIYQQTTSSTSPSSLQVDKSELYSAKNAIVIEGNFSTNRILGNKFFDNYIGVRYINHQSNAQCENRSNQYIPMQPFANLIHPYTNRINSWKGVDIENSNGVVIGTNNLFNRLDFGIFAANSSFSALGNTFTNIARNPAINLSGNAIYAEDMNLSSPQIRSAIIGSPAQPNTFTNCYQGASLFNMDAQVRNNIMTNMINGVRVAWCTNGNLGTPNTINIADNDININQTPNTNNTNWGNQFFQYKYGINCVLNTRAAITISHNTINLPQAQSVANQTVMGVVMDEFSNTTANNYTLNNANHVEGGDIAYRLNNIRGAMLEGNEAINHPNGANYAGFWLDNSPANTLQCNNVNAVNGQYSTRGYRLTSSTGNFLNTNKAANAFRGIEAFGNCNTPNGLRANVLNNNFLGLVVRNSGRIGIQGLTIGSWIIPMGNSFSGNAFDLCNFQSIIPSSDRYIYNNILNPNLPNSNLNLGGNFPIPLTIGSALSFSPNPSCAPFNFLVAPNVTESEMQLAQQQEEIAGLLQAVQQEISYPVYPEVMKFLDDKELFEKIRESTELQQDSTLYDFYEEKQDENIGKIAELDKKLQELNWSNNPLADENTRLLEKANKILSARSEKEDILAQDEITEKWKSVAEAFLKVIESNESTLDEDAMLTLYQIAVLCPHTSGPAVHQARALLNALDAGVWVNDEEACSYTFKTDEEDPLLALSKDYKAKPEIKLLIFPVPAKDYVRLAYQIGENEGLSVEITNTLGQVVIASTKLNNWGSQDINTRLLTSGIYFLKISEYDRVVENRKIIIEH